MNDAPSEPRDYRGTVFLPNTPFPMRGDLPKREPAMLERWTRIGLWERLREQSKGRTPFILHDGTYANLETAEDVFTVGINRAVDILAEKKLKGFSRPKQGALRDMGPHPDGGGNLQIMSGRYGAYVKFGKVNATLPQGTDPQTLSMDDAVALINARAGQEPKAKRKAPARKTASKTPAVKAGSAVKKAPAKKAAKKAVKAKKTKKAA